MTFTERLEQLLNDKDRAEAFSGRGSRQAG